MLTNAEFFQQRQAITARYMPDAKNQTRVLRSQGKLVHAAHYDADFARAMAQMRATDAMRHGVAEDMK